VEGKSNSFNPHYSHTTETLRNTSKEKKILYRRHLLL